jgi:hypothetical protein
MHTQYNISVRTESRKNLYTIKIADDRFDFRQSSLDLSSLTSIADERNDAKIGVLAEWTTVWPPM